MIADIVDVAWAVASALESIGAAYCVGGSVASSLQATARSTNDVDFVVELRPDQAQAPAAGPPCRSRHQPTAAIAVSIALSTAVLGAGGGKLGFISGTSPLRSGMRISWSRVPRG